MPINGETLIVGPYVATYNGTAVGIAEGDAGVPTLVQEHKGQPVDNTDRWGKSMIDWVHLGVNYRLQMTCMEYKTGSLTAFAPFAAVFGRHGTVGALGYTSFSAALVLTVIAGTPAVGNPNTFTASKATISPGFNANLLFGPMIRTVPLNLQLLPYLSGILAGLLPISFSMG